MNDVDRLRVRQAREREEVRALIRRILESDAEVTGPSVARRWRWSAGRSFPSRRTMAHEILREMEAAGELISRLVTVRGRYGELVCRLYRRAG